MAPIEKLADLSLASDAQLLEQLASLVRIGRRVTAELVAHLSEVDERRLHLKAGYNSLFAYCVSAHRMSEDEACRRIEVARLGRRFPSIFPLLAGGQLSLSVAALLKTYLTEENQHELLAAVSEKSVTSAREALAARFPLPDAAASVRKLPERAPPTRPPRATESLAGQSGGEVIRDIADRDAANASVPQRADDDAANASVPQRADDDAANASVPQRADRDEANVSVRQHTDRYEGDVRPTPSAMRPGDRGRIEPTALGRYRVQFTVSTPFKEKLELLRDLMSHRNPTRDFAPIVEQALDLLLENLLRERTGKADRPRAEPRVEEAAHNTQRRPSRATQRDVSQRDGLRCSFVGSQGRRCEGRAFLEYDHVQPFAKGGQSGPANMRLLCRAHNRLFAETEFGSAKIRSEIAQRREQAREAES